MPFFDLSVAIEISIISMLIVFGVLTFLAIIISQFKSVFKSENNNLSASEVNTSNAKTLGDKSCDEKTLSAGYKLVRRAEDIEDEDMLAALIVASMEANLEAENEMKKTGGETMPDVRVKSIRRVA